MSVLAPSRDEILERLRDSWPFWAENVAQIINTQGKLVPLVPKPAQLRVWEAAAAQQAADRPVRLIIPKARKEGVSTFAVSHLVQRATMRPNHNCISVAQDTETAGELLQMATMIHANLPDSAEWPIKPQLANRQRRKELSFGNPSRVAQANGDFGINSRLVADTAKEFEAGRGFTYHAVHCSEVALWADSKRKLTALLNAVPDEPGTFVILESTSKGYNHWRTLCKQAQDGLNDFELVFLGWFEEPQYVKAFLSAGEREEFIETIGTGPWGEEEPELVEAYGCSPEQLNWRRWAIANRTQGDLDEFHQEYPACVTAETRVSTDLGIVPIAEVSTALHSVTESGPIEFAGPMTVAPIFKVTTEQGRILRGTDDHPVHTPSGKFVGIADLAPGDEITLRPPMFANDPYVARWNPLPGITHSVEINDDWAAFLGYFMGDGSWHKGTISVVCTEEDEDVQDDVRRLLTTLFRAPAGRHHKRVQGRKGALEWRCNATAAEDAFKALGLISNGLDQGKSLTRYRRSVHVPDCIWRSPRDHVRLFLAALFEADGSASGNCVRFSSYRPEFVRDVQLLLLGFGITGRISCVVKCGGQEKKEYRQYDLQLGVEASRLFHDRIGFRGQRKNALRPPTQTKGRPPAPVVMVDRVVSVEPDGEEQTYDLTIAGEHVFSANGILTHNTLEQSFLASGGSVFSMPLVSRAIAGTEKTPPVARGTFEAGSHREYRSNHGPVRIPENPGWVDGDGPWRVWVPPVKDAQYVVGADPAGDDSMDKEERAMHAGVVIDHRTREQVAEIEMQGDSDEFALQLYLACLYYNRATLAVETTGSWGAPILRRVRRDWKYMFVYKRKRLSTGTDSADEALGFDTNRTTKGFLIEAGREMLREGTHGIRSRSLAGQFATYVRDGKSKYGPSKGERADLLMAYLIAHLVADETPIRFRSASGTGVVSTTGHVIRSSVTGY